MSSDEIIAAHRLVGEKERQEITSVSRSAWRALERRGRETGEKVVPNRIAVSPGKTVWRLADLVEWVRSRPVYKGAPPPRAAAKRTARRVAS